MPSHPALTRRDRRDPRFCSYAEAAAFLGVAINTITHMVTKGRIETQTDPMSGDRRILRASVERLQKEGYRPGISQNLNSKSRGRTAAKAFQLISEGCSWHDLIMLCEITPEQATELWNDYRQGPIGVAQRKRNEILLAELNRGSASPTNSRLPKAGTRGPRARSGKAKRSPARARAAPEPLAPSLDLSPRSPEPGTEEGS